MIGILPLFVNVLVKKIPVDKFAFCGAINLERVEPSEFINRWIGWFENMQERMLKGLKSDEFDGDMEKIKQLFLESADGDNLVKKEALKDLIKASYKIEGKDVPDNEILEKIQVADIKQEMITLEEYLHVRDMKT